LGFEPKYKIVYDLGSNENFAIGEDISGTTTSYDIEIRPSFTEKIFDENIFPNMIIDGLKTIKNFSFLSVDEKLNEEIDKYFSTQNIEVEKLFINKKISRKHE